MREVLAGLPVKNLWLHKRWEFAAAARPYFANKRWTDPGPAEALHKEYDMISELVDTAEKRKITIQQPFAGMWIGPFRVVSPFQAVYPCFIPQFDRTPDTDKGGRRWPILLPSLMHPTPQTLRRRFENRTPLICAPALKRAGDSQAVIMVLVIGWSYTDP
jgi:hypothetical protein